MMIGKLLRAFAPPHVRRGVSIARHRPAPQSGAPLAQTAADMTPPAAGDQRLVTPRRLAIAASHHITWKLGMWFPDSIPLVYVVGYPKSGTVWASCLVSDYLKLPYPALSLFPIGFRAVVHGHETVDHRYPRCVYVLRDGRDALTSFYFYLSRPIPPGDRPRMTRQQRQLFPGLKNKANVRDNMAAFVERQLVAPYISSVNWADHARSWFRRERRPTGAALIRYEDLLADGPTTLARAMRDLTGEEADDEQARFTVDKFSFERMSGRKAGQENREEFLRKGESGDWANHFSLEAAEIFDRYAGDMLIAGGYERDRDWVKRFAAESHEYDENHAPAHAR